MTRPADKLFELLSDEENARACQDISEDACKDQPRSFTLQLLAQIASKCADTLGSSRVVLPWLLSSIGAPAFFIAWLVALPEFSLWALALFYCYQTVKPPLRC